MCDDAMTKAAADEMQRLYRALYAEYEEAKQRRVRHEEEAKKVQEQRNRLAAADKELDRKLDASDKAISRSRAELEKLKKEKQAIEVKMSKLRTENAKTRNKFTQGMTEKIGTLDLALTNFAKKKCLNNSRKLESEKSALEVSIQKHKLDNQVCMDLIKSMSEGRNGEDCDDGCDSASLVEVDNENFTDPETSF
ncbi:uncharacterized protein LOC142340847 [Convolutriloba macropyga]|uniref:uncharacterized protein LOC142340847 n=1 Tax=Convolutriloba macropyga TaxID=536237 RepID=UPI003F527497